MTLAEHIRTLYCPPVEYKLAGSDRVVKFCKPTGLDAGRMMIALQDAVPEAQKCIDLMREDVRLRQQHPDEDVETPWSELEPMERANLQQSLVEFENKMSLARARLCLRHDPESKDLTDEDIRFLVENDSGFVDAIERLCGADDEDPTGKNDSPLGSQSP